MAFQPSWTEDLGSIFQQDIVPCALYVSKMFFCRTSSVKRHFETREHPKIMQMRQNQFSGRCPGMGGKANTLKVFVPTNNRATEASYRIAHCIAKHWEAFHGWRVYYGSLSRLLRCPVRRLAKQRKYKGKNKGPFPCQQEVSSDALTTWQKMSERSGVSKDAVVFHSDAP